MNDLVMSNIIEDIIKRPMNDWVAVSEATLFLWCLEDIKPCTFGSLPSGSSGDDDLGSEVAESSSEWFNLAYFVVL